MEIRLKRGFSPRVRTGLAHLGVFLNNFEKETTLMNLCNVKGKVGGALERNSDRGDCAIFLRFEI